MTRTELLEHFLKPTDLTVKELIDRNAFAQIMQFAEAYHLEQLHIADVRQRCLKVVSRICTETDIDEQVYGWIDDLDFVEIVMEAELEFDCKINEGETTVDDFEKVNDLINWMVTHVA